MSRWANGSRPFVDVQMGQAGEVILPVVAYPFHGVKVDSVPAKSYSRSGRLAVSVPAGEHRIDVTRQLTRAWWLGLAITLFGVVALIVWLRKPMATGASMVQSHASTGGKEAV